MFDMVLNVVIIVLSVLLISRIISFFILRRILHVYSLDDIKLDKWIEKKLSKQKRKK